MSDMRRIQMEQFVARLHQMLSDEPRFAEIRLEVFGSINSGFGNDESDLDICVVGVPFMDLHDSFT